MIILRPKVLLIDDNITIIKIITSFLEIEGFKVFSTTDSSLALKIAQEVLPEIILLDIVMPQPDGFEVCKLLKADDGLNEIPVIILTAETGSHDLRIGLEAGAIDYIRKPVDQVELAARVHSVYRIKQYQDKLKELALRDSLTGLYNHGTLIERFVKEYNKQAPKGGNVAFIMIDIDDFKKINDTYGHLIGDAILKEIAYILSRTVASAGIVSRYGGEEFGVIISDIYAQAVGKLCEEIRENIQEYKFTIRDEVYTNLTVSIGFCSRQASEGTDYNEILKKADAALYAAKRSGRNRVIESLV